MPSCLIIRDLDAAVFLAGGIWLGILVISLWVWRQNQFPGKRAFLLAHLGALLWVSAVIFELGSMSVECKMLWSKLAWPGITLVTTAWAYFLYDYALGRSENYGLLMRLPLIAGPIVTTTLAVVNPGSNFYGAGAELVFLGGRVSMAYEQGPIFWWVAGYLYCFIIASMGMLAYAVYRASAVLRPFFVVLTLITISPVVGNLLFLFGEVTLFGFDPTPFLFSITLGTLGWLIANNRMMDIQAVARDLLFYNTRNPVLVIDGAGHLINCNPAARERLGDRLPPTGETLSHVPDIGDVVASLLTQGKPEKGATIALGGRHFDPRAIPIESPINPNRPKLGWTLALFDITDLHHTAAALREAATRAEAANTAKDEFLAVVSHELRTPLTSVKGAIELLLGGALGPLTPEAASVMDIARTNSKRLALLIEDLLDLQKIETGELEIRPETVDLAALVRDAVASNERYANVVGVDVCADTLAKGCRVHGDPGRLMQVVTNVLSNAIKFSDKGDTVDIRLEQRGPQVRLSIADKGIGIPEGARDKVFGRFSQVDASATRKIGGSGLGMHITKQLVERHGGSIDYDSVLGEGTTFFIDLPLIAEFPAPEARPAERREEAATPVVPPFGLAASA